MARQNEVRYINFYTAGSAAYQYDPQPIRRTPKTTLPKPRTRKKTVVYVDPVAIFGIAVALVLLVCMVASVVQLSSAYTYQQQLRSYIHELKDSNEELQEEYLSGYDPQEVKAIAEAMGMVPLEQVRHISIQAAPPAPEEPAQTQTFWTFLARLFA